MKNFIFVLFLVLSLGIFAQWEKQGVASGVINDITAFDHSVGENFIHIGAETGIFYHSEMYSENWYDESLGLKDSSLKKICGLWDQIASDVHAVLSEDGVYAKGTGNFVWADEKGLQTGTGQPIGYKNTSGIALEKENTGRYNVYLSLSGYGIFKRPFCGNSWCSDGNPIFFDDVEGATYWEASGNPNIWHKDKCKYNSASFSWKAGADDYPNCYANYPPDNTSYLTMSQYVDLGPPGHGFKLRFWEYLNTEYYWDPVKIQVQQYGQSTWEDLAVYYGYSIGNRVFSLEKYSGQIKIRFVFTSDSFYEYEGWYIDDIEISKDAPWQGLNPQIPNPYVTDLYFYDDGGTKRLYATTVDFGGSYFGHIYSFDGYNWTALGDRGVNYLSIDGPKYGTSGKIISGTQGNGIYEFNGSNFVPFCSASPPPGDFISVSVDPINPNNGPFSALTPNYFYKLDPTCSQPYQQYSYNFKGRAKSTQAFCNGAWEKVFYVGTNGFGLMSLDCKNPNSKPKPIGNEKPSETSFQIRSKGVSSMAISYKTSDDRTVIFASSKTDGMYKAISKPTDNSFDYFLRYFYNPLSEGTSKGLCVAIVPDYNEDGLVSDPGSLTIYLGTSEEGIFKSNDGGASWEKTSFPDGYNVVDIVLSPQFFSDLTIFALTSDAKVFISTNGGNTWNEDVDLGQGQTYPRGFDLEISPFLDYGMIVFAATNQGLWRRTAASGWQNVFGIFSLSVSLSPLFGNSSANPPVEGSTVLVGTYGSGIYYSNNYGNFGTFNPAFSPSSPLSSSIVPVLRLHNRYDVGSISGQNLYTVFLASFVEENPNEGIYEMYVGDNGQWVYNPISGGFLVDDFRISDIQFHPYFNRQTGVGKKFIYASHKSKKIFRAEYGLWNWISMNGFYHTPQYIYSISEKPDDPNIVLAGTKGFGPMISFDGGFSYFPWGSILKDNKVMHDVHSVSFTHSIGTFSRGIASAGNCSFVDSPTCSEYYGIYYSDYTNPNFLPNWQRSSLCLPPSNCSTPPLNYSSDNFNGHLVKEIRYTNLTTDIEGADFTAGPIMSDPNLGGQYGIYWQIDLGGPDTPASLSDSTYPASYSFGPGRDTKSSFIWGAQGKTVSSLRVSSTPGAYKWSKTTSLWSQKNGNGSYSLPDADFRSIYSISENEVLIGAGDGNGIYKTEDGGYRWLNSNNGLEYTSKKVTAISGNSSYIFASLQETSIGSGDGGIYLSDCQSKGYAWVYYSNGMSCSSSYELSLGSTIYTGSTCDGIYGLTTVEYLWYPKAYFTFKRENPWNEREVKFYDRSAGLCTQDCSTCPNATWSWICEDGFSSSSQNPSNTFSTSGSHLCSLTVQNTYYGYYDTYNNSIYIPEVLPLYIEKYGSYLRLYWQRLPNDETEGYKYKIYRDTSPQGTGLLLLQTITPPDPTYCNSTNCWYVDTSSSGSVYYYRIFTE